MVVGSTRAMTEVFKVYVDGDRLCVDRPVSADRTRSRRHRAQAAFDDIATVAADLHIKATLTDKDGDSTQRGVGVALQIQFQDDGPLAVNDLDSVTGAATVATGNVITGREVGGDNNLTDGSADTVGTDGAKITEVSGATEGTFLDGDFHGERPARHARDQRERHLHLYVQRRALHRQ